LEILKRKCFTHCPPIEAILPINGIADKKRKIKVVIRAHKEFWHTLKETGEHLGLHY